MKNYTILLYSLFLILLSSCGGKKVIVSVNNESGAVQGPRVVELNAPEIMEKLGSDAFYVTDASGKEIPSQLTADSLILFVADVPRGESMEFMVNPSDSLHVYPSTVEGRIYPERRDDVAYENEKVGFRIYGPATQAAGEKAFGYDLFFKYPTDEIILPSLYAPETDPATWAKVDSLRAIDEKLAEKFINSFSYHIDHGKGMDCYAVGPTLGAGVAAVADNDSISYPWCYEKAEIIDNGPLRFTLRLTFAPRTVAGRENVVEHRLITLDSQSHLNRAKVWFDGLDTEQVIVAGFPRRDDSKPVMASEDGILAYSDPTQGPDNGRALLGIVMPAGADSMLERDGHYLATKKLAPGSPFEYLWGFAWDKTDIKTMDDWRKYLSGAKASYKVSIK